MLKKKTDNVTFLAKNDFSISPNAYEFFSDFFLILDFFLVLKKRSKVQKFGYVFAKRLHSTLKKFLVTRLKRFTNTTQTFFDKRGFQKLEKNLKKFICIRTNGQINFG